MEVETAEEAKVEGGVVERVAVKAEAKAEEMEVEKEEGWEGVVMAEEGMEVV